MTITIVLAAVEDYDDICRVLDEGDAHHREALPQIFHKPPGPARPREYLRAHIEEEHKALFVARKGDELVGTLEIEEKALPRPAHTSVVVGRGPVCLT